MLAIGRYHIGAVLPEWINGWEMLNKPTNPDGSPNWVTFHTQRQLVHTARNLIIEGSLARNPDDLTHVFFIDDDVIVPPDGLLRLLDDSQKYDLPIVTGWCIQRSKPFFPCVYRRNGEGRHVHLTKFCDGLQEIDACGGACLLIRVDVLRAIQATGEPWFDFPANGYSEDLAFCDRATRLGFRIALDFRVKCTHLGILEANYDLFKEIEDQGIAYDNDEVARLSQEIRPWKVD